MTHCSLRAASLKTASATETILGGMYILRKGKGWGASDCLGPVHRSTSGHGSCSLNNLQQLLISQRVAVWLGAGEGFGAVTAWANARELWNRQGGTYLDVKGSDPGRKCLTIHGTNAPCTHHPNSSLSPSRHWHSQQREAVRCKQTIWEFGKATAGKGQVVGAGGGGGEVEGRGLVCKGSEEVMWSTLVSFEIYFSFSLLSCSIS